MAEDRIALLTHVNPSGDVLEDIRAGARVEEPWWTDHQQLDRLFARLRDDAGELPLRHG